MNFEWKIEGTPRRAMWCVKGIGGRSSWAWPSGNKWAKIRGLFGRFARKIKHQDIFTAVGACTSTSGRICWEASPAQIGQIDQPGFRMQLTILKPRKRTAGANKAPKTVQYASQRGREGVPVHGCFWETSSEHEIATLDRQAWRLQQRSEHCPLCAQALQQFGVITTEPATSSLHIFRAAACGPSFIQCMQLLPPAVELPASPAAGSRAAIPNIANNVATYGFLRGAVRPDSRAMPTSRATAAPALLAGAECSVTKHARLQTGRKFRPFDVSANAGTTDGSAAMVPGSSSAHEGPWRSASVRPQSSFGSARGCHAETTAWPRDGRPAIGSERASSAPLRQQIGCHWQRGLLHRPCRKAAWSSWYRPCRRPVARSS